MRAETPDSRRDLWNQALEILAQQVGPQIFETWFRPIILAGFGGDKCELVVPTDTFRQCLMEYHADVLGDAIALVTGTRHRLEITVASRAPVRDDPPAFPVLRASELEDSDNARPWLIERLWTAGAAGFVSGPPKSLKTWTVLEMAVSVASGTPCFGSFPVPKPGPVLLYAAEDPLPALRLRIQSLARNHGLTIDQVEILVITADSLRLDRPPDREKLMATVDRHRPALVILDPLVRLHGQDENQSGPMAELLGHIRALQRKNGTAVTIVHHCRKAGTHSAGQSMRGSSDLYAFLDSLVSLHRRHGRLSLSAEHRSAPGLEPLPLELVAASDAEQGPSLRLCTLQDEVQTQEHRLQERITSLLSNAREPLATDSIRAALQVRKQRVLDTLRGLCESGVVRRDGNGYQLAAKGEIEG